MNETAFIDIAGMADPGRPGWHARTRHRLGFCERCVAAGIPLARGQVFIDTLHPVHEGRLFRWGHGPDRTAAARLRAHQPGRLAASGFDPSDVAGAERWRHSPFYKMLQTGHSVLRRRLNAATENEFSVLPDGSQRG